jgi:UDP-N-acetylmuramoylalanine--D-glutamate ligase
MEKRQTTALTGKILESFYKEVYVVGNIGKSFASVAEKTSKESVIVAEISSFQLETTDHFCPQVSAILNLTPDHLDRHKTMKSYLETKLRIAARQGKIKSVY